MFKYLQRIFGKSSTSYKALLESRDPKVELSENAISQVVEALNPILLQAHSLELQDLHIKAPQLPAGTQWPVNKKGISLVYMGTVENDDSAIAIFQNPDGLKKDPLNVQIILFSVGDQLVTLQPENEQLISKRGYVAQQIQSLPIWEEIIHREPSIHKLIVKLAPDHPWTLYKKAKKELCSEEIYQQLGGYPQWFINDVDFRKIKPIDFRMQIKDSSNLNILYYFTNDNEIESIIQTI